MRYTPISDKVENLKQVDSHSRRTNSCSGSYPAFDLGCAADTQKATA